MTSITARFILAARFLKWFRERQYVQYFEYARFEFRFNMPSDMKVGLTNIGRLAMKKYYGPSAIPSSNSPIIQVSATDIQARAYVSHALVAPGATNTLFVVVRLPDYKAVANAQVNASILIGDKITRLPVVSTDADGIAKIRDSRIRSGAEASGAAASDGKFQGTNRQNIDLVPGLVLI